jgi:hypothetical protein
LPFKPRDQPYGVCFERMFESDWMKDKLFVNKWMKDKLFVKKESWRCVLIRCEFLRFGHERSHQVVF